MVFSKNYIQCIGADLKDEWYEGWYIPGMSHSE